MKILLVEDDESIANVLTAALTTHHYTVEAAVDGQTALHLAQSFHYDLLLLDIILPDLDGISLCRQLRSEGSQMPILLLSALDSSADRVMGLEAGADDYLVKPYDLSELMARIQALLRRSSSTLPTMLNWGKLQLNPDACQVTYAGRLLHLTPKEYGIIELLLRNPRRIFSRSAILDKIWPSDSFPQEEAVSTQIKGLRQKLKASGMTTDLIETVYGLGYRLKATPSDSSPEEIKPVEARSPNVSVAQVDRNQAQARVTAVVQQMWEQFKESLVSPMVVFERAIAQLSTGSLNSELRQQVKAEVHRLIGSLGSMGCPQGSEVARQIEQLLQVESLGCYEAMQFEALVGLLKQAVENKSSSTATSSVNSALDRLLIVDDDALLTEQVKRDAIAWGLQVDVATNLMATRQAMASHPPDVILLDLTFSQTLEKGLTLLTELTSITPPIPVLVMTGRNELSDRVEVARLGAHAFLQKPIASDQILTAVNQALNRAQKAEANVLIVDDDRQVLAALSHLLEPWGLRVTTLADPQKFWQMLEASRPDLLILDVEMPGFSGIELCQVVRNDSLWNELPILFLSAYTHAEIVHQVFAAGADDYVCKPVVGPELIARILNRLKRTRILHKCLETDELTGTTIRRKSLQDLEQLLHQAKRQHQPLCFAILDINHFKRVNEQHGFEAGDRVLRRLGELLKQFFGCDDVVARWSGQEFVLGLYGITRQQGMMLLTSFLETWRQQQFTDANHQTFQVNCSAGVAQFPQDGANLQELYRVANTGLSRIKAVTTSNPQSIAENVYPL